MSKLRPCHHEGVKCFSKMRLSVGLDYIGEEKSVAGPASEAKDCIDMILAGAHGYPTEGAKYWQQDRRQGLQQDCQQERVLELQRCYQEETRRRVGRQVILASSLRKFL